MTPGPRQPFRRWAALFGILVTNADLRLFWSAISISNVGTWMQVVAQDWLVLVELDAGAGMLGLITALQFAPALLAAPLGGVLADRFPKRHVLIATNLVSGILSALLGILALTGTAEVWHVLVLALLLGTVRAVDSPARLSLGAELVELQDVPKAIALSSMSFNLARLVGPGFGGIVIAVAGTGAVFVANAITFAVPCVALLFIGREIPRRARSLDVGIMGAIGYVWRRPRLRVVVLLMFFSGFAMNMPMIIALMANDVYRVDAAAFGVLGSIMAIGSLVGTLYAGVISPHLRVVLIAVTGLGSLLVLQAAMPTYLAFAATLPVVGAMSATMNVSMYSFVQMASDPGQRGRVTALATMAGSLGHPLGALLAGWTATVVGARFGGVACGVVAIVGVALSVLLLLRARKHPEP